MLYVLNMVVVVVVSVVVAVVNFVTPKVEFLPVYVQTQSRAKWRRLTPMCTSSRLKTSRLGFEDCRLVHVGVCVCLCVCVCVCAHVC